MATQTTTTATTTYGSLANPNRTRYQGSMSAAGPSEQFAATERFTRELAQRTAQTPFRRDR